MSWVRDSLAPSYGIALPVAALVLHGEVMNTSVIAVLMPRTE